MIEKREKLCYGVHGLGEMKAESDHEEEGGGDMITVNIRYTGVNGSAQAFAGEMIDCIKSFIDLDRVPFSGTAHAVFARVDNI